MSLLDHPEAQPLLNDATLTAVSVRDCTDRLTEFLSTLPAAVLSHRTAAERSAGHPRPAQRLGSQDLRANRH